MIILYQGIHKISAITEKFVAININYSHRRHISKIKRRQIIEFTIENVPYKAEVLNRAGRATWSHKMHNVEQKQPESQMKQYSYVIEMKLDISS